MFLLRSNLILILLALFTPFFYLLKVNIFEIALNDTYSLVFFLFLVALILSFLNYFSLKYLEINLNFVFTIIIFINFILSKIISSDFSFKIYLIQNFLLFFLLSIFSKYLIKNFPRVINFLIIFFSSVIILYLLSTIERVIKNPIKVENKPFQKIEVFEYFHPLKLNNDIYHIVLDGFASLESLEEQSVDTGFLVEKFNKNNLKILKGFSNYPLSNLSFGSFLNGSLFKENYTFRPNHTFFTFYDSSLFKFLKKNDYKIFLQDSIYPITNCSKSDYFCEKINFFDYSFVSRYFDSLNFETRWIEKMQVLIFNEDNKKYLDSVEITYDPKNPKYSFFHYNIPHTPWKYDQNCKINSKNLSPKNLYLNEVKCISNQIIKFKDRVSKINPKAIIIVHSDHGWTFEEKDKPSPENLNNDWPESQYKTFISVHDPLNCFDTKNKFSNNNLILNLLGCLSGKENIYFENNNKKYSYYSDNHPLGGKILKRN